MPQSASAIGPYTIEREIGRGGMGVVFLATDTRLGRKVAIKALPEHLAQDPDRLARFEREARTLASLNHPNVAAIYGVEEVGAQRFLVLEYVEGETLQDLLRRGPMPIEDALEIAIGMAAGLEAAHEAGIVHRDLKPANVKITPEGRVKVLDFGLAKSGDGAGSSSGVMLTNSPTMSSPVEHSPTIPGAIMGTAPYMSPEQARGRAVDKRSDIWSFGVVLYECLTGISPFHGETATDSIGAILHKDVDLGLLPPHTPAAVRHALRRCLERDRNQRLRDIGDARLELERAGAAEPEAHSHQQARTGGGARTLAWSLGALAVGIGGTMLALRFTPAPAPQGLLFSTLDPAPGSTIIAVGDVSGPAVIAPDGSAVAFSARDTTGQQAIWLRRLDRAEPERLRGTEWGLFPFWSADSRSIAFFSGSKLRRIDLGTRSVRTICDAPAGRGGAWLDGGVIVFAPYFQSGLSRVDAEGGEPEAVTTVDGSRFTSHRWPSAVRGTDRFVYLAVSHDPAQREQIAVFLASLDGRMNKEVIHTEFGAQIIGDRLLYLRESTLLAAPIDAQTGALRAEPQTVLEGVGGDLSTWNQCFSASESGALVFHPTAPPGSDGGAGRAAPEPGLGESVRATIIERSGRPLRVFADGMLQNSLAVSPDGLRVAISGRWPSDSGAASYDIWVYDIYAPGTDWAPGQRESIIDQPPLRFTFMTGDEVAPQWSPDGKSIAFSKIYGPEPLGLFVKPIDGGAERMIRRVGPNDPPLIPGGWSRDGRYLVCKRGPFVQSGVGDIVAVPLDGGEPIDLVVDAPEQNGASVSNDNRWLVFDSDETGTTEVYVTPFSPGWEEDRAAGRPLPEFGRRDRVSIAGGALPRWSTDGKTLHYASQSNSMIGVGWRTDGTRFVYDAGRPYFDFATEAGADYDVFPTDELFVVNTTLTPREAELRLVMNWPALLKK